MLPALFMVNVQWEGAVEGPCGRPMVRSQRGEGYMNKKGQSKTLQEADSLSCCSKTQYSYRGGSCVEVGAQPSLGKCWIGRAICGRKGEAGEGWQGLHGHSLPTREGIADPIFHSFCCALSPCTREKEVGPGQKKWVACSPSWDENFDLCV